MYPVKDWLLLKLEPRQEAHIALPDTFKPEQAESAGFIVVEMGPDVDRGTIGIGDTVILEGVVRAFEYKNTKYLAARQDDVAFIVTKAKEEV